MIKFRYVFIVIVIVMYFLASIVFLSLGQIELILDAVKVLDRDDYVDSLSFFDSYTLTSYVYRFVFFIENFTSADLYSFYFNGEINIALYVFVLQASFLVFSFFHMYISVRMHEVFESFIFAIIFISTSLFLLVPSKDFILYILLYGSFFVWVRLRYLVYAYFLFRLYLVAVFVFYIFNRFFLKKKFFLLLLIVIIVFSYFFAVPDYLSKPLNYKYASTGISNFFENSNMFFFLANGFLNSIRLLLPLEFVFVGLGGTVLAFYKLMFSIVLFRLLSFKKDNNLFLLVLAFLFVQGCFEPDLGSALRHMCAFIPFVFYLYKNRDTAI